MVEGKSSILDEISELLSQQKLVPFFRCQHLGFAAAEFMRAVPGNRFY